jgi:hypothetical protein
MVKNPQARPGAVPPVPPTKRGRGKPPTPELSRTDRLIMRAHPDLVSVVGLRAAERGMTRSKFIEQLLIGFLAADPRNPKISAIGKIDFSAPEPLDQRKANPHRFAERWQRFVSANTSVFGTAPPVDWPEEPDRFWTNPNEPAQEDPHAAGDAQRAAKWAAGKNKK